MYTLKEIRVEACERWSENCDKKKNVGITNLLGKVFNFLKTNFLSRKYNTFTSTVL